jgi:hypothetical protein
VVTASRPGPRPEAETGGETGGETGRDERARLDAAVAGAAREIAALLDQHPVRPGPFPLPEVLRELAAQQAVLQRAVEAYPLALAVDEAGRPDPLGPNLAGLIAYVQHTLVLYHNLPDLPDRLRVQAHRNLSAVHLWARRVRDRGPRR